MNFDVAIVGGGPAGTSAALHLVRREGVAASRIVVIEKARHPRDKPCAGAVSRWGLDALGAIGILLDVPHTPMHGLRVLADGAEGTHEAPLGVVVRRSEFDASLWRHIQSDGVVAIDGEPVVGLERVDAGWKLRTTERTLTARFVAACDGTGSVVRRLLRIAETARKGHLYVTETPFETGDVGPLRGFCDFDLRVADDGVEGYYWDFPTMVHGSPAVNRGIYHANFTPLSTRDGHLKRHLAAALSARGVDIASVKLKPFSTRPLVRGSTLVVDRVALVGEAAGIDATTGEGIAQAILTARIAAAHLAAALRSGDSSLYGYPRDLRRARVGRHLLQSAWLARQVYGARGASWRRFLARSPVACKAGARWYSGSTMRWTDKGRLGLSLAFALAFSETPSRMRAR